jgi:hypothetical protein
VKFDFCNAEGGRVVKLAKIQAGCPVCAANDGVEEKRPAILPAVSV